MFFDKLKDLFCADSLEKATAKMNREKNAILKNASKMLARDFSAENARSDFYVDNNYGKPYSQSEWIALYNKLSAQDAPQALTPMYNAIVVMEDGFYFRRGLENLRTKYIEFAPGENDQITHTYAVEPYTYKKTRSTAGRTAARPAQTVSAPRTPSYSAPAQSQPAPKKELYAWERAELNNAKARYERAVGETKRHPESRAIYESLEKKAHADYMAVLARYAGRE